jgi:hypothetical protein
MNAMEIEGTRPDVSTGPAASWESPTIQQKKQSTSTGHCLVYGATAASMVLAPPCTAPNLVIDGLVIITGAGIALLHRSRLVVGTLTSIREGACVPARLHTRPRRLPSSRRLSL